MVQGSESLKGSGKREREKEEKKKKKNVITVVVQAETAAAGRGEKRDIARLAKSIEAIPPQMGQSTSQRNPPVSILSRMANARASVLLLLTALYLYAKALYGVC